MPYNPLTPFDRDSPFPHIELELIEFLANTRVPSPSASVFVTPQQVKAER